MAKCKVLIDCNNLQELARLVLFTSSTDDKLKIVESIKDTDSLDLSRGEPVIYEDYMREDLPVLVSPSKLSKRKISNIEGRAALVHAIAHIEYNAIHLAADAIYRFSGMPDEFYLDWLKVMQEEAKHFSMLQTYLHDIGYKYGDFNAHNGLWEMAKKTAHSVTIRMALVPRLLEARGLDVTPGIIEKFKKINDTKAIDILNVIFEDEIGHVLIGNRWYRYCCEQESRDSIEYFKSLLHEYARDYLREPIYDDAREQAGFSEIELKMLHEIAS